jgi:hypothetical protein
MLSFITSSSNSIAIQKIAFFQKSFRHSPLG